MKFLAARYLNTEALALLLCFYQCMPSYQLHCARRAEPVRSSASRPSKLGMELAQRLASSLRSANCRPVSTTTYCAREVIQYSIEYIHTYTKIKINSAKKCQCSFIYSAALHGPQQPIKFILVIKVFLPILGTVQQ